MIYVWTTYADKISEARFESVEWAVSFPEQARNKNVVSKICNEGVW